MDNVLEMSKVFITLFQVKQVITVVSDILLDFLEENDSRVADVLLLFYGLCGFL